MKLQELKTRIARQEIDTVLVVFPDVFGRLVGKRFSAGYFLEAVVGHGTHGCNYLLTVDIDMEPLPGFKLANWEKGYGDFKLQPDLSTLRLMPWQPASVMVLGDLFHHDGAIVAEAPRSVLQRQTERLRKRGLTCMGASEPEFFLFNTSYHAAVVNRFQQLVPSSDYRIDYHTLQPGSDEPLMRAVRNGMEAAEVPVESSKGEWGRGQHEINFRYCEPLLMADRHLVFKHGLKEIATQQGKCVSFMAKYDADEVGSSCHLHLSFWRGRQNAFWDNRRRAGSKLFRQVLGGLLKYSPELCYFYAPTINSYKRYQPASWAPTKMAWAFDNRTVGFRVVGEGSAWRVENRLPGADANPYLAFAAMIAAGRAGIEEDLDCGELYEGNAYVDEKLPALPHSLRDAAERLAKSELARTAFGSEVVDFYVHTARTEVQAFDNAVTDWERVRYFERI